MLTTGYPSQRLVKKIDLKSPNSRVQIGARQTGLTPKSELSIEHLMPLFRSPGCAQGRFAESSLSAAKYA